MKLGKSKRFTIAIASMLLAFSAAASVTGTVAWFTASNVVSATGMSIQADTEAGLLIANELFTAPEGKSSEWNDSTVASHDGKVGSPAAQAKFIPTSTNNASVWYHANAAEFDNHASSGAYAELTTAVEGASGVYKVTDEISVKDKYVYLLNTFHLKASTPSDVENATLYVNKVTASGSTSSVNLNKALRVLVKYGSDSKIFAPFDGATLSYNVHGDTATTAIASHTGNVNTVLSTGVRIPASTTANNATLAVNVYIYFEGEDAECKSSNITATLDTLSLDIKLGTQTL